MTTEHPVAPWLNEPRRAYLYRVSLAVIPLLSIYGIVADNTLTLWAGIVAAVLNVGLATANTSTKPDTDEGHDEGSPFV